MSAHEEQATEAFEVHTAEQGDEGNMEFSPNFVEERIKANLEPIHAQITMQTQMMSELTQYHSARTNHMASPRDR